MNLLELWRGSPQEQRAIARAKNSDANRGLTQKERKKRYVEAFGAQRRILLRRIGIVVGGTTLMAATGELALTTLTGVGHSEESSLADSIYGQFNSNRFKDNLLPQNLTLAISQDLISQTNYPSLVRSGRLLNESQSDPHSLARYDPALLAMDLPIGIGFRDLGINVARENSEGKKLPAPTVELRKKDTKEVVRVEVFLADPKTASYFVELNNYLLGRASRWVYRLMIAKESSHSLYHQQARDFILDELGQIYDFPQDDQTKQLLGSASITAAYARLKPNSISPNFVRLGDLIDYAGYGHIVLDLGSLVEKGLLTESDKKMLGANLMTLEEARKQGVIEVDKGSNRFTWASGASSFSPAWFGIMDKVYSEVKSNKSN